MPEAQHSIGVDAVFRDAMRGLAATVTIVTAASGGRRYGMTATSVTSVSMAPPSILVCINQAAELHGVITDTRMFCVNILRQDHVEHSRAFSGALKGEERFAVGTWARGLDEVPYLAGAQSNLFCRPASLLSYGSHTIVVGEVLQVNHREDIAPLLYQNRGYAASVALPPRLKLERNPSR